MSALLPLYSMLSCDGINAYGGGRSFFDSGRFIRTTEEYFRKGPWICFLGADDGRSDCGS